MASFDLATFNYNQGAPGGVGDSSFGVPHVFVKNPAFTSEEMRDMPSSTLRDMLDMIIDVENKADAVIKEVEKKALIDSGMMAVDTEEGVLELISDTSRYGLDRDNDDIINDLQAMIDAMGG